MSHPKDRLWLHTRKLVVVLELAISISCFSLSVMDIVEAQVVTVELSAVQAEARAELFQTTPSRAMLLLSAFWQ
jgi:hypothetical protein